MTYRNEVLPEEYAQGSSFGIGFDTRIVELESGSEHRVMRHNGRRRYSVNLDIWGTDKLFELFEFYTAVANGALHSFKFKDWLDYATTEDAVTHNGQTTSEFDYALQFVAGRTYRTVKTYSFGNETYTRFLRKLVDDATLKFAVNGAQTMDYVIDTEEGLVTFGGSFFISTATWGGQFYTVVRFAEDTDELFNINLLGPDNGELPSIQLIEDITDYGWSQDFPAGGAHAVVLPTEGSVVLNQFLGRVWSVTTIDVLSRVILPTKLDARAGGPHFFVFNSGSFNFDIHDDNDVYMVTLGPDNGIDFWLGADVNGNVFWIVG